MSALLPPTLTERLKPHLPGTVEAFEPVSGGCIAEGGKLVAGGEAFFLKRGSQEVARTFPREAEGLRALRAAHSPLYIPGVRAVAPPAGDAPGFLLMEWMEPGGQRDRAYWEAFGEGLAALHRHTSDDDRYGFQEDNFIGRLPQANGWQQAWPDFFRTRRLEPQVQRARENGRWRSDWNDPLNALFARLPDLLPGAPPASMLHGDLWSGNVLASEDGTAALIDPAAYYGHREADLAMTELFGGFEPPFYDAYRSAWPLEAGYAERRDVYNLYHLINHLNHFGTGYAGRVGRVLKRYGA